MSVDKFALFDRVNAEARGRADAMDGRQMAVGTARFLIPTGWENVPGRQALTVSRSLSHPADPDKKAARKRQKKARKNNRKRP